MNVATSSNEQMLNKVPQLTIYSWIIKIMATTVGETVADLLAVKLNLGLVLVRRPPDFRQLQCPRGREVINRRLSREVYLWVFFT